MNGDRLKSMRRFGPISLHHCDKNCVLGRGGGQFGRLLDTRPAKIA
jgi:hypothetical protein